MNKKLTKALAVLVLSSITTSQTALARKRYYEEEEVSAYDAKEPRLVYDQEPYYAEPGYEDVIVEERGDRGRSVAKGVGIGAVGGGLLGLAASGGKGKGFGYGALAGAGFGGLMGGAFGGRGRRYRARRPVYPAEMQQARPRYMRTRAPYYE